MKPFDPKATCPQCGGAEVDTEYVQPREVRGYIPDSDTCSECRKVFNSRKHLDRRCERCGYTWPEACVSTDRCRSPRASAGEV